MGHDRPRVLDVMEAAALNVPPGARDNTPGTRTATGRDREIVTVTGSDRQRRVHDCDLGAGLDEF
jgi:hypothetical protein